jgi:phenylpropionate dioxygenase-like ring-hydroxylating dioxygenase large terminal subunit
MFHAWSYAVSGELIGVPDESMFFDFDRAKCGLQGVACDLWNGWVFVNLDPAPAQSLADWLGAFGRRLGTYPFQEFASVAAWRTEVRANWKVGMDAFQESYHVTGTHGGSLARLFLSKDNPFGHCAAAELDEPHRMHTIVTGGEEYKLSPAAKLAFDFGTGGATVRTRQAGMVPPECNPSSAPNWAFDVHVFFPNFFIDIVADGFFTHQFWPVAADRSIFETRRYYRPADHAGQLYAQELSKAMFRDVAIEDCATIELTQQGISSGARQQLLFGDQELLCRHQYHVVEQYLAGTEP